MKSNMHLSYCLLLSSILFVKGQEYTSVIRTASGPIRGIIGRTIENFDVAAFKGIPYAKPPVGLLRFKPPVEVNSWTDVYNATRDGSFCTQFNSTTNSSMGSEDCLYINVYTPHTEFNSSISKPVMAWIYGGAFTSGYSNQYYYGPDFIIGKNVILVSFNYRVGPLGFLNLEHENATGNCGLKDQNLALKWIKRNIANFGGNPNKITIFGQSAGSASVDLQVLSDMSADLFSQSISMSGATLNLYWGFQSGAEAVEKAFALGSKLGTKTLSKNVLLKTLYEASAADLIVASEQLGLLPFRPTLEKIDIAKDEEKFLTECSLAKYTNGNYSKGPHMMGFTMDETVAFLGRLDDLLKAIQATLKSLGKTSRNIPILNRLADLFTASTLNLSDETLYQMVKRTTDLLFILGIDTKQKMMSRNNAHPIYYYRFSFASNYSLHKAFGVDLKGAGHADDVPYIFYAPLAKLPLEISDIVLTSRRIVTLWTNFAKYSDPTPFRDDNDEILGTTNWPDSRSNGECLDIGTNLTIITRPTNDFVKTLELFGLGASPILNDCRNNVISDTINSIIGFIPGFNGKGKKKIF